LQDGTAHKHSNSPSILEILEDYIKAQETMYRKESPIFNLFLGSIDAPKNCINHESMIIECPT
jgi:hypothetical protein